MRKANIKISHKRFKKLQSAPCVYAWRRGSRFLYVGFTTNFLLRTGNHSVIGNSEPMLPGDTVQIWVCRNRAVGERLALKLQEKYRPRYSLPLALTNRTKEPRKCLGCGVQFVPKRWWQRYHSSLCRNVSTAARS
jgi:hypothetical protein